MSKYIYNYKSKKLIDLKDKSKLPRDAYSDLCKELTYDMYQVYIEFIYHNGITFTAKVLSSDNNCNGCMFQKDSTPYICPSIDCIGKIFIEVEGLDDDSIITRKECKDILCNSDICPYNKNCNQASICLIDLLFNKEV